jgi:hypothetical protein
MFSLDNQVAAMAVKCSGFPTRGADEMSQLKIWVGVKKAFVLLVSQGCNAWYWFWSYWCDDGVLCEVVQLRGFVLLFYTWNDMVPLLVKCWW